LRDIADYILEAQDLLEPLLAQSKKGN